MNKEEKLVMIDIIEDTLNLLKIEIENNLEANQLLIKYVKEKLDCL